MTTSTEHGDPGGARPSADDALKHAERDLEHAEHDLGKAEAEIREAESEIREAKTEIEHAKELMEHQKSYALIVNRLGHTWPREEITGKEIKVLAGSPSDWVVNQIVDGPGEDPEVLDNQVVHLDKHAEPKGEKRFTTRKPKTSPGA